MARNEGMEVLDRPDPSGPVRSWMYFMEVKEDEKTYLRPLDFSYDSIDSLKRQLHFFASLKDQYSGVYITLPGDIQLIDNFHVLHGRTAYEDDRAEGKVRHLKRLWLETTVLASRPPHFMKNVSSHWDERRSASRLRVT